MTPFFKAYCYLKTNSSLHDGPHECAEISFQASPDILRDIANFMIEAARKIEALQNKEEHFHLQDEWREWSRNYPDVIVVSPSKELLE